MNKRFLTACLFALFALVLNSQLVLAHETIKVGNYEIVYGWVNEPPIVGERNGVELFVKNTSGGNEQPVEEISSLVVKLSYGAESKTLTMEQVFETPGAFGATVLPTIPGLYSIKFSGTLGDTPVDAEGELQEVEAADAFQFPSAASTAANEQSTAAGTADWVIWLSLLLGLSGVGLGAIALRKPR